MLMRTDQLRRGHTIVDQARTYYRHVTVVAAPVARTVRQGSAVQTVIEINGIERTPNGERKVKLVAPVTRLWVIVS